MISEKMVKCGFVKDENYLQFNDVFKNNVKLKEVHIDIYPYNPILPAAVFTLLLRAIEYNVTVINDGNRLILKKCDKCETYLMNVLCYKISECFSKVSENCSEFVLNIQNIYYKITILN